MRAWWPAVSGPPSTLVITSRSSDSSPWKLPAVPSAQYEPARVFGWFGSGPSCARPSVSVPLSQRADGVAQSGAVSVGSHAAWPGLLTVTPTAAETPTLPAASTARAWRVCEPFETFAVLQLVVHGAAVTLANSWP